MSKLCPAYLHQIARLETSDVKMTRAKVVRERKRPDGSDMNGATKQTHERSPALEQMVSLQKERGSLVLWKRPLLTFYYFLLEILVLIHNFGIK